MGINLTGSCTLEMESLKPFRSVGHAIAYYNLNNPARLKPINFLEPEGGGGGKAADFTGEAPAELWSSIVHGICAVFAGKPVEVRQAFSMRYIGDRTRAYSVEDIALSLHRSTQTVYRYLNNVHEDLEREFARRELIEISEESDDNQ